MTADGKTQPDWDSIRTEYEGRQFVPQTICRRHGITPAQLALAWVLSRGEHVVALPGTRSIAHLDENLAAASLTVDTDILAAVDAMFPANALRGPRYNAFAQSQIDTETLPDEELA